MATILRISQTNMDASSKAFIEGLKLVLRLYVFSIVPILGGILLTGINTQTGEILINWAVFRAVFLFQTITFVLAGLDKFKHTYAKETNPVIKSSGKSAGILKF